MQSGPIWGGAPPSAREWLAALAASLAVAALCWAPYGYARSLETPDLRFMGSISPWPEDTHYHLAWARQAYDGRVLLADAFNGARAETRRVVGLWFLAIGWTGRLLGIPLRDAYDLVRTAGIVGCSLAIYAFLALLFERPRERALAFALALFASGLGWLREIGWMGSLSADLFYVEAVTFWHLRSEVVTTPTVMFFLLALSCALLATRRRAWAAGAFVFSAALALTHPHNAITLLAVLALLVLTLREARGPMLAGAAAAAAGCVPVLAYDVWVVSGEPVFRHYVELHDSFRAADFLYGWGALVLLGAYGAHVATRGGERRMLAPLLWIAGAFPLLFVPIPPLHQFFLIDGLPVALAALAARGWFALGERRPGLRGLAPAALLVAFTTVTHGFQLRAEFARLGERAFPYYWPRALLEATDALAALAGPDDVVLAPMFLTPYAPAASGARVVVATDQQTVDYEAKRARVERFFSPETTEAERAAILREERVDYVLAARERAEDAAPERFLEGRPALERAFANERATLYAVRLNSPP